MGRREWRPRPGLRQAMAFLAGWPWRLHRPDRGPSQGDTPQSSIAAADRLGLEPGRSGSHGAAALPLPVPVLCVRGPAFLPALPTIGRYLPRRAVQHRLLRAADADGGAGDRTEAWRFRPHAG